MWFWQNVWGIKVWAVLVIIPCHYKALVAVSFFHPFHTRFKKNFKGNFTREHIFTFELNRLILFKNYCHDKIIGFFLISYEIT